MVRIRDFAQKKSTLTPNLPTRIIPIRTLPWTATPVERTGKGLDTRALSGLAVTLYVPSLTLNTAIIPDLFRARTACTTLR